MYVRQAVCGFDFKKGKIALFLFGWTKMKVDGSY